MNNEHVISDEAFNGIQSELSQGNHWLAYNTVPYFLEKEDIGMFHHKDEADEFAVNNISEYDNYRVIQVDSIADVMRKIPFSERLNQLADPDANGLYNRDGNAFTDALIDQIEQNQLNNSKKLITMNEKNLEYLNNQIKYTGFGEGHRESLKEKIGQGQTEFALFHQADFGKDSAVATLQFKKGDESDMYFFNRYNLMLKGPQHEDPLKQTFYINNKGDNITLKEAYNMMSGRAIHKELTSKEGEKYKAWLQLDFKNIDKHGNYEMKKYHQNYGFDLEKALAKQTIKELGNETDKTRLMESLQRGNRQAVTLQHNGNEKQVFVEAAPQFKSLNFYDSSMKRLTAQSLNEKQAEGQTEKKEEKKETVKQEKTGSDEEGNSKKQSQGKSKRKGQSV